MSTLAPRSNAERIPNQGIRALKPTKKRYRSEALQAAHLAARDLHKLGAIDKATMRRFDISCLTPVAEDLKPESIKQIRESAHMSQAIFALVLNVTKSLVSQWERGEKHPQGASLKLLTLVAKNGLEAVA